ncbi:WD repeat-containing protein 73-like [Erythrolamprus reginae]|uniref:WD repeat-containing protein 73-like n=1 Tax=Erythrolamprus reginae TaxID=121349 RepID=UPI00396CA037
MDLQNNANTMTCISLNFLGPPESSNGQETNGLCPERDFKVQMGRICDRPIYSLKHVPGTSLLVTSGPPDSVLQVWRTEPDETDMMKLLRVISPTKIEDTSWSKIATSCAKPSCVLHGQRICNLQMTEIESEKSPWVADTMTCISLNFLGPPESSNGQETNAFVWLDTRMKAGTKFCSCFCLRG